MVIVAVVLIFKRDVLSLPTVQRRGVQRRRTNGLTMSTIPMCQVHHPL